MHLCIERAACGSHLCRSIMWMTTLQLLSLLEEEILLFQKKNGKSWRKPQLSQSYNIVAVILLHFEWWETEKGQETNPPSPTPAPLIISFKSQRFNY